MHDNTTTATANLQAEAAVLGSLLIDPTFIDRVALIVKPADFFAQRNAAIYAAMLQLLEQKTPIDLVTLADELERRNDLEDIGGLPALLDLAGTTPTSINAEHYATIVRRASARRKLIGTLGDLAETAYDPTVDDETAMLEAVERITTLAAGNVRSKDDPRHISSLAGDLVNRLDELTRNPQPAGTATGFNLIDRLLGGLGKGTLNILAARPSMGKTSLALNIALNVARRGQGVAVFSLEMSGEQLTNRLVSQTAGIDSYRLRIGQLHDDEWPILFDTANMLAHTTMYIDDTPALSIPEMRIKFRKILAEQGTIDLVVIDYLQLMSGAGKTENRQDEVARLSRELKAFAREFDVPMLVLSQLNRSVESRADKRPLLSDLRESGAVEQDADVVMFIYRDDYYNEDSDQANLADVIVAKHRTGATGTVTLYFRKELTQFRDIEIHQIPLE